MDLGAMAMKGYSAFPKAPALLKLDYQIVLCHIQGIRWCVCVGGVLPPCKNAITVFYSPRRLGKTWSSSSSQDSIYELNKTVKKLSDRNTLNYI